MKMKRIILALPILILACVLSCIIFGINIIHPTTTKKSILILNNNITPTCIQCYYIAWLGHQNIGDEVLHKTFLLTNELYSNYFFINQTFSSPSDNISDMNIQCAVLGGGSLINSLKFTQYLISPSINGIKGMFGSGTDDSDMSYNFDPLIFPSNYRSEIMKIIINKSKDITEFCSSLHEDIISHHERVLLTNPKIIRGYITKLILDCTYIRTPNAAILYPYYSLKYSLIGDSGMLSYKLLNHSKYDKKEYKEWFDEKIYGFHLNGELKIAVNIGGGKKYNNRTWEKYRNSDAESILDVFNNGLIKFCKLLKNVNKIDIILWSIWPSDNKIVEELNNKLRSDIKILTNKIIKIYNLAYIQSSTNIIRLHKLCDMSLTYKLHAMILSQSSLCPGVHLVYRIKGMDHATAVDLIDYAIGTDIANSKIISEKLLNVYYKQDDLRKHIEQKRIQIENAYKQWWMIFDENLILNN